MPKRPPRPPDRESSPRYRLSRATPKLSSIRDLSRLYANTEQLKLSFDEVEKSSDRSACIIMSSIIERTLERGILLLLDIIDQEKITPLFERDRALSSFFGNIYLAYAINLISMPIRDDLNIIRIVRNAFAHSSLPITFQSDEIKREIRKFNFESYSVMDHSTMMVGHTKEKRDFVIACTEIQQNILDSIEKHVKDLEKRIYVYSLVNRAFELKRDS